MVQLSRNLAELLEQRLAWIDFIVGPVSHGASKDTARFDVFAYEPSASQLEVVTCGRKDRDVSAPDHSIAVIVDAVIGHADFAHAAATSSTSASAWASWLKLKMKSAALLAAEEILKITE